MVAQNPQQLEMRKAGGSAGVFTGFLAAVRAVECYINCCLGCLFCSRNGCWFCSDFEPMKMSFSFHSGIWTLRASSLRALGEGRGPMEVEDT